MDDNKINIFIADNSDECRNNLLSFFKKDETISVSGHSRDGKETLEFLKNNSVDVLVMDVVLSSMDGFELLEIAKLELGSKMPKVIITSTLCHEGFVSKAMGLGVLHFLFKPIVPKILAERIHDILGVTGFEENENSMFKNMKSRMLDEKISNVFITVGIPAHIKGYHFLREAIKLAIRQPDIINSITKGLYPSIAEKFSTSSSKVERAIRHAIEVAWNRGRMETLNSLFGYTISTGKGKPTNSEFIALIADKIRLQYKK